MATEGNTATTGLVWLALLAAGTLSGVWLGQMVADDVRPIIFIAPTPYADLTGNPDALTIDHQDMAPCTSCPDSYGSARYASDRRTMNEDLAYRDLGRVWDEQSLPNDPDDDYRYGGRFPDTESSTIPSLRDADGRSSGPDATVRKKGDSKRVTLKQVETPPDAVPLDRSTTPLIY